MDLLIELLKKYLLPPDVNDEAALRKWLNAIVDFAQVIVKWIPGPIDDQAVAVLADLVENDAKWAVFYQILKGVLGHEKVGALDSAGVTTAISDDDAEKLGIPIGLLVRVILFIISILKKR